jgi:hypothetical protein
VTGFARDRSRWSNAQTAFSRTPTCRAQTDCDGANLSGATRIAAGICGSCAKGAARRAKPPAPLKGGPEPIE